MRMTLIASAALIASWVGAGYAQSSKDPHAGHHVQGDQPAPQQGGRAEQGAAMQKGDPHAGHQMPSTTMTGPWAHTAAGSPPPHTRDRWEMVPAGDSPLFVSAHGLSKEQRCGAINASKRIMVDEATRAACAGIPPAALVAHDPAQDKGSATLAQAQAGGGTKAPATINSVDAAGRKVNVTHGPIPQIGWPGMTMDLAVSDRVDLKGVRPGDRIEMTLKQGADGIYLIDSLGN